MIMFQHDTLILDASCVISLYATQRMGEILAALPPQVTVATYVAEREALYIRGAAPEPDAPRPKLPIQLAPFIQQGLLRLVQPEGEKEAALITYLASQIRGQGEVVTGAIGICRQWGLVVDDRRARNLLGDTAPQIQLLHTLDLVRYWVGQVQLPQGETTAVLTAIRTGAAFMPHPQDPNWAWWHEQ